MNHIKSLASQSVIYGFSSIIPRFLTYFLNPLYAYTFISGEYGKITILYTYVQVLNIILTYGLETGFFYFSKRESNPEIVFSTAFLSHIFTTFLFIILSLLYVDDIASVLKFEGNNNYIIWFIFILGFDTISAVPFAKLRSENKAFKFAMIKTITVSLNVLLNFLLLYIIPKFLLSNTQTFLGFKYEVTIELVFIVNFITSLFALMVLSPVIFKDKFIFDRIIWKKLLLYSLPLMVAGLAGWINEAIDRVLLQHLLPESTANSQIGIYGANIKLAVIMTLFIQMFRFAAEPFFFNFRKTEDQNNVLSDVTKYFVLYGLIIFLGVTSFIDILKYFVGPSEYWVGLPVVPVYLLANLALGVYFNLSFWYKLTDKTYYGILITGIGSAVSICLNFILIPKFSYFGCVWVHLTTYIVMNVVSYLFGRKFSSIRYNFKRILFYVMLSLIVFCLFNYIKFGNLFLQLTKNTILLILFILYLEKREHIISIFIRKNEG